MPEFITNILAGIGQWVNGKIADVNTAIESKQDVLTAGENIEITSGGTISATDTTYVASDFDIKDLADSTGLRNEWSSKQNSSDNSLNTNTKTIIGAINELLTRIEALEARNQAE